MYYCKEILKFIDKVFGFEEDEKKPDDKQQDIDGYKKECEKIFKEKCEKYLEGNKDDGQKFCHDIIGVTDIKEIQNYMKHFKPLRNR